MSDDRPMTDVVEQRDGEDVEAHLLREARSASPPVPSARTRRRRRSSRLPRDSRIKWFSRAAP